jgi:hypothetical protein
MWAFKEVSVLFSPFRSPRPQHVEIQHRNPELNGALESMSRIGCTLYTTFFNHCSSRGYRYNRNKGEVPLNTSPLPPSNFLARGHTSTIARIRQLLSSVVFLTDITNTE